MHVPFVYFLAGRLPGCPSWAPNNKKKTKKNNDNVNTTNNKKNDNYTYDSNARQAAATFCSAARLHRCLPATLVCVITLLYDMVCVCIYNYIYIYIYIIWYPKSRSLAQRVWISVRILPRARSTDLSRIETDYRESVRQGCVHGSKTKDRGSKTIRYHPKIVYGLNRILVLTFNRMY